MDLAEVNEVKELNFKTEKMNKKLIIFGIAILLICIGLSGCEESNNNSNISFKSDKEKIIGNWIITELYIGNTLNITYTFMVNNIYIVVKF